MTLHSLICEQFNFLICKIFKVSGLCMTIITSKCFKYLNLNIIYSDTQNYGITHNTGASQVFCIIPTPGRLKLNKMFFIELIGFLCEFAGKKSESKL